MKILNNRTLFATCCLSFLALCASAHAQSVLTWHNDNARTGQNLNETILTPQNVIPTTFGKVFSYPVQGQIYAQPLYVPQVTIPNKGTYNVVFVATEHDQVYAFDADGTVSTPLWQVSFINPAKGITTVPTLHTGCNLLLPEAGISSTPVIDPATGTIYITAATSENRQVVQRLHALDITTGAEKFNGPVVIQASVDGVPFDTHNIQRSALLLLNGAVYFGYAYLCAPVNYHGWILGYNSQNLQQQVGAFVTTPTGDRGGVWQAGGGPASDGNFIYFMTGDGTFDVASGGKDIGMSMVKLDPSGGTLKLADYFTPFNEARFSQYDRDLGSGGVLLLPQQGGSHPFEIIGAGKAPAIFVADTQNMGKYNSQKNNNVQTVYQGTFDGYFVTPAYWQQKVYYSAYKDYFSLYKVNNGLLSASAVSKSPEMYPKFGCIPSISANAAANGIAWCVETFGSSQGGSPAILRAYDANNLANELYSSDESGSRDQAGPAAKFTVPTVINGRVYVATQTELDVYGLLSQEASRHGSQQHATRAMLP